MGVHFRREWQTSRPCKTHLRSSHARNRSTIREGQESKPTVDADEDVISLSDANIFNTANTPLSPPRGLSGAQDVQDGTEPRLLRFQGRPDDITPKALVKMMLGNPLPFDRHDWIVDRGGNEVFTQSISYPSHCQTLNVLGGRSDARP